MNILADLIQNEAVACRIAKEEEILATDHINWLVIETTFLDEAKARNFSESLPNSCEEVFIVDVDDPAYHPSDKEALMSWKVYYATKDTLLIPHALEVRVSRQDLWGDGLVSIVSVVFAEKAQAEAYCESLTPECVHRYVIEEDGKYICCYLVG